MKEFEILHLSHRLRWASGEKFSDMMHESLDVDGEEAEEIPDWQYYIFNLVFRASGEFKDQCMLDTKIWKPGRVCLDTEKYEEYLCGIEFDFVEEEGTKYHRVESKNTSGIDCDSLFVKGYEQVLSTFLRYHDKFDVFQYRDYLQYNPSTTGILLHLEELKNGIHKGITAEYSQFYGCLRSLENFWD
jgi:hypothetical protein